MGNSKMMIGLVVVALLVIGGIFAFSSSDDNDAEDNTVETSETTEAEETVVQSNVVELAQATDSLSTLVSAVIEAELVDTLSSAGPFTVFAPTNDAFAALLADLGITAEELLAREDLSDILTYHVVAGEAFAADLSDGQELTTVQGGTLTVSIADGVVSLVDANGGSVNVASADIDASNGVVHVIDGVVLP